MEIIVGFSKPKNKYFPIISWLIRSLDKVPFSHTYLRWKSKSGAECFYHAATGMVHFLGSDIAREELDIVEEYSFTCTKEEYRKFIRTTHERSGIKYAKLQLIGMMLVRLFKLKRNPFSDGTKTTVCSEEVGHILRDAFNKKIKGDLEVKGLKYLRNWCRKNLRKLDG